MININQVYKSVLVVLQQEKRGVLTPVEFNKVATQAQQEIFIEYFDELNQLLRQPQTSLAYADRYALLDEKIQIFKRIESLSTQYGNLIPSLGTNLSSTAPTLALAEYDSASPGVTVVSTGGGTGLKVKMAVTLGSGITTLFISDPGTGYSASDTITFASGTFGGGVSAVCTLTLADINSGPRVKPTVSVQELGSVIYFATSAAEGREAQRIQQYELYTTNQSPLTKPTEMYPVYIYEDNVIQIFPETIPISPNNVQLNFLKYPEDVRWGFTIDTELGNYIYNPQSSVNFELHQSDEPLLVDKILGYAGVMTRDQLALQLAAGKEQQIDVDGQK
tara:strand:+ start:1046 stop:2047 length:1002 start_codon:yes stop_codon:yes gene_type:complete